MTVLTDSPCLCTLDEVMDGHRHHCPAHKALYPECSECQTDEEEDQRWEELFNE